MHRIALVVMLVTAVLVGGTSAIPSFAGEAMSITVMDRGELAPCPDCAPQDTSCPPAPCRALAPGMDGITPAPDAFVRASLPHDDHLLAGWAGRLDPPPPKTWS